MAPGRSPESALDEKRRLERLQGLVDQLKSQYAGALTLYYLGYSHAEVGDLLGCTAEAARKLVTRAEARLVDLAQAERLDDNPA